MVDGYSLVSVQSSWIRQLGYWLYCTVQVLYWLLTVQYILTSGQIQPKWHRVSGTDRLQLVTVQYRLSIIVILYGIARKESLNQPEPAPDHDQFEGTHEATA